MKFRPVIILLLAALACPAMAQQADYSKTPREFPNVVAPYKARHVPPPMMTNSPRTGTLVRDGKIMLSLNDAIALALENNLDLGIARYNLSIADTDLLRTKAGASLRGVATGLVQGTLGGGVGGFGAGAAGAGAGGTSGGAGGAGTGASGQVLSTLGAGSNVDSYDPNINAQFNIEHATTPLSNTILNGVPSLQQNVGVANFNYQQAFPFGTQMNVTFDNNRITTNSPNSTLVPVLNSSFRVQLRQHLLSGFGLGPNLRFIRIARNNREISDVSFRNQVVATVSQIQNIYWDLVNAYEDVRVKERAEALAEKTLADNKEQVRIGSLPPLEVSRAEATVAAANQDLILARTQLELQQLLIKNAITRNLNDNVLADANVIPTDTMSIPQQEQVVPIQDLVSEALAHRPELVTARIDMTNRTISKKAAANALMPQLDLVSWYGASGLSGVQNPINANIPPGTIPQGGFQNAFHALFRNDSPDYAIGLNLNIPLRNRAAQADQIRSELEYRQAEMRLQQLQNQIAIEVRNAQFALQQGRARVDAARKSRDLATQSLDIEQKKMALGASTSNLVLQSQRDLAQAESNLVTAMAAYEKSRVELDRVTGSTLQRLGIDIVDAERGAVEHMPAVPGAEPRPEQPNQQNPGARP